MTDTSNTTAPNVTDASGTGTFRPDQDGDSSSRPGGDGNSGRDERIAQLEAQLADMSTKWQTVLDERQAAKEAAKTEAEKIDEVRAELATERAMRAAATAGARNPATVARLIAGAASVDDAVASLKTSDPYLFGTGGGPSDNETGDPGEAKPGSSSGDPLTDYLRKATGMAD